MKPFSNEWIVQEFLTSLSLSDPRFLVFAVLLPLFWLARRQTGFTVILWRSAIFLILVLVLSGPELSRESAVTEHEERIIAFDISRSVPVAARQWMLEHARAQLGVSARDRVMLFGGRVEESRDWESLMRADAPPAAAQPEQTNFEPLFLDLLQPTERPRSLFLYTDGWQTAGDIARVLPLLGSANLKVFPVAPPPHAAANVAVKRILAPHEALFGETVQLRVMLENDNSSPVEGVLSLRRNGQPFRTESVTLKPGSQIVDFDVTLAAEPSVSFEASFAARLAASDLYPEDNRSTAWISARAREKALILNGRPGQGKYLADLLRRRGFEVDSVVAGAAPPPPAGHGLVIFNNVEREKFTPAYLAGIEKHTAAGNAFLMLGGEQSFGPDYKRTPIETILPVELQQPPKRKDQSRAVMLVIDKSGSMREENRILYAREAAKAVVEQLRDFDFIGVVAFDHAASTIVTLAEVGKLRATYAAQMDRLVPGGRTNLMPGLLEAKRQLERQEADRKHIIVLSDGETSGTQSEYVDLVSLMRRESRITVSVVAVGGDVNVGLMNRIAQYGGGFYHHTYDPASLPKLMVREVEDKPEKSPPPEDVPMVPVPAKDSQVLASFPNRSYPPVRGYVTTELKNGAKADLMIARQGSRHPLLASWSYRGGKAVAFTSDLEGYWTRDWVRWGELEKFWSAVFEWLQPAREPLPPHELHINAVDQRLLLDLYVYEEDKPGSVFRYRYAGKSAQGEGALKKLAPGRYQTVLPFSTPGDYKIELFEEDGGRKRAYPALGYTVAFDPRAEMPRRNPNLPLLEQLARASGGEVNPDKAGTAATEKISRTAISLRPPLILTAAVLFLLEIYLRRLIFAAS